ncbi:hypothetical protein [Paenibacillus sp. N3.4]|uniref:hypothetical protein n=1 Tax=Paenibacillus sp. N3.4 TaxID=2603222 RepID=UPI0011C6EC25|nr:hypothetical protein [Paenibacillus sp. N3.4]TXK77739.1 hypothetical protein FU659_21920 [Paenibacillus sp. N3.4]
MRIWFMMMMVVAVVVTGCSKKDGTSTTSPAATTTVQPSPGAPTATGGTSGTPTGGGTATGTPGAGSSTPKAEPLPKVTKAQVEKISLTSTYDDMVKQTGSKGKLAKEENGKKTYEFEISDQPGYYVDLVYFDDGKMSEKRVFQK